jgi:hypothetical protein
MQDNFSFSKIQGGSSLFMKSDHDGVNDAYNRNMPLGIKTVGQGIEEFTDWQSISDVLEEKNLANFEDASVNKISFSQSDNLPILKKRLDGAGFKLYGSSPFKESVGFEDEWSANKVKVYDDMAFVAYEEYTDLHRVDIELSDAELRQYLKTQYLGTDYDMIVTSTDVFGSLALETELLTRYDENYSEGIDGTFQFGTVNTSIDFASYQNSIIKVEFSGTLNRGSVDKSSDIPRVGYFVYGGTLENDIEDFNTPLNGTDIEHDLSNTTDLLSTSTSNIFGSNSSFEESAIMGKFFLVVDKTDSSLQWGSIAKTNKVDSNSGKIGIQLSMQSNYSSISGDPNNLRDAFPYTKFGPVGNNSLYFHSVDTAKITLIKVQPVRKCGKVDIYTKKRSIVSAIVNNSVTSNGHNLNTNDIVEISGALFDGTQNGVADIHPLNGIKYVKVVDQDTFEIYDDKFFKDPSFTDDLRTTDGIIWKCVSNNFGSIGQSWDYHGSLFSPTGRNGYKFIDQSEDNSERLASSDEFFTTKRLIPIDDATSSIENESSITLKFDADYDSVLFGSEFGETLDKRVPKSFGAHSSSFDTPLNDPKRAYWDFYPYNCQDDKSVTEGEKSSYWGCRFGCDLDIKYSHTSGNSRIYTLAIGERGSDFSVDMFGVYQSETHYAYPYSKYAPGGLYSAFRKRIAPWSLPHGKTHLLKITVDQYNRISDISHVNTVFGGGTSIVDDATYEEYGEPNPWRDINTGELRNYYKSECLNPSTLPSARRYDWISEVFNISFPVPVNISEYWTRAAVVHWIGHSIPEYRVKNNNERSSKYLRKISAIRKTVSVDSDGVNNRSRFGSVGFGGDFTPYQRISRYSVPNQNKEEDYYLFPWVDSFGKSVALENKTGLTAVDGYSDSDIKTVLLSASTCRSNIESRGSRSSVGSDGLSLVDSTTLTEQDTVSEIGQIQANFIYSDGSAYTNIDFMYLNSGGADCDRLFSNLTIKNEQRSLKDGSQAGFGMPEVITSCALSASSLEWYNDQIIWTDQELYSGKSTVNILRFDDGFTKDFTLGKSFIDPRVSSALSVPPATNTGDGFGATFCFEGDIFVTNARSKTTELGYSISDYLNDRDRIDYIYVFERLEEDFVQTQKISATIDKMNEEDYSLRLLTDDDNLLDLPGSASYANNTINTLTWDVDFSGRYDLINNKILIKDPLEYSLFSRDYSISSQVSSPQVTEERADIYLGLTEKTKVSTSRSSNSLDYEYISASETEYVCRDVGGPDSTSIFNRVPFFFFKLPVSHLDVIEDVTINFDIIAEDIFSLFDLKGDTNLIDQTDNIIPRIVLYSRDPRTTIIENGPADNGSSNSFPKYQNGIWSELETIVDGGDYYSHDFPGWYRGGAQDMFFYGRLPGSSVKTGSVPLPSNPSSYLYGGEKNLGEYYDLTAGTRLSGSAGEPAWVSPDVFRSLSTDQISSIVPYAKIFLPTASADGYSFTIPRDTLKDYIIKGSALKDSDRTTSVVSGFNDTANAYGVQDIDYTIIIGFLLTNIESFDLNTSTITYEEPSSEFNVGALRYILKTDDDFDYVNARYPYSNVVNFYDSTFEGAKYNNQRLEYDLRATIKSVSASVSKRENTQNRYSNKFHKIAVFAYDEEPRDDVRELYRTKRTVTQKDANVYKAFGRGKLVPVPNTSNINPIISIGKKSSSFGFGDDHEILATENILQNDTSYYLDKESGDVEYNISPTGSFVGSASFNQASLLGGFDLDEDKFLSLNISSHLTDDSAIENFVFGHGFQSGVAPLLTEGVAGKNGQVSLYASSPSRQNSISTFINAPLSRPLSLFTYEIQPSAVATAFMRAPDADSSISLTMNNPKTGVIPMFLEAPSPANNSIPLVRVPTVSGTLPAYIDGIGLKNSNASLYTNPVYAANNTATMTFSPGHSGDMSLFLARNLESSGNATLVMPNVLGVYNSDISLWVGRNGDETNTSLFVKPERLYNSNVDLYVNSQTEYGSGAPLNVLGPLSDTGSSSLFLEVAFTDSGNASLNMPTVGVATGSIPLHISQGYETMPLFTPIVENPRAPLYISGLALEDNKSANLFLKSQYAVSDFDMIVKPIDYPSGDISLNITGSLESNYSLGASLFIGKEINANGQVSLFTNNDIYAASAGATGVLAENTISISGGIAANNADNRTLYIGAPESVTVSQGSTLFLNVDEPTIGPGGGIISSGVSNLLVEGNNDGDVWIGFLKNNQATLSITAVEPSSGIMPLYIDQPEQESIPMYISSLVSSGDFTVYITGANIGTGSTDLYISPPEATGVDMFTRGYLE